MDDGGEPAAGSADMRETDRQFVGSIPETYDRYLGPLLSEPYARDLAARLTALAPATQLQTAAGTQGASRPPRPRASPAGGHSHHRHRPQPADARPRGRADGDGRGRLAAGRRAGAPV